MDKTAFVTGAAGFLGRHVMTALLSQGWRVTVMLRGATPAWMPTQRVTLRRGALEDAEAVLAAMPERPHAVFHLAANASMWVGDAPALMRDNVMATRHVVQAAARRRAQRIVMTSTLGIFRSDLGDIDERTPLRSRKEANPYLRTKLLADDVLSQAAAQGLSVVSLHPSHMLGRFDQRGWVRLFDDAMAGKLGAAPGGAASFCSVGAVARAHLAAAEHASPARRYVLGGPLADYRDVFERVARLAGVKPPRSTVPAPLLKTVARLSGWASTWTRRPPALTPGLAAILCGRMVADASLAQAELGFHAPGLDALLAETHQHWLREPMAKPGRQRPGSR